MGSELSAVVSITGILAQQKTTRAKRLGGFVLTPLGLRFTQQPLRFLLLQELLQQLQFLQQLVLLPEQQLAFQP